VPIPRILGAELGEILYMDSIQAPG